MSNDSSVTTLDPAPQNEHGENAAGNSPSLVAAIEEQKALVAPCPFCGVQVAEVSEFMGEEMYRVECLQCGAIGPAGEKPSEAVSQWNARESRETAGEK